MKRLKYFVVSTNCIFITNSSVYMSDGEWHHVEALFSPTYMELSTDDHIESQPTTAAENKYFDLSGFLFIGGIEVNKQARAVQQGVINGDKRFVLYLFIQR